MDDMALMPIQAATEGVTRILLRVAMRHPVTAGLPAKDTADPTMLQLRHQEAPLEEAVATIW